MRVPLFILLIFSSFSNIEGVFEICQGIVIALGVIRGIAHVIRVIAAHRARGSDHTGVTLADAVRRVSALASPRGICRCKQCEPFVMDMQRLLRSVLVELMRLQARQLERQPILPPPEPETQPLSPFSTQDTDVVPMDTTD